MLTNNDNRFEVSSVEADFVFRVGRALTCATYRSVLQLIVILKHGHHYADQILFMVLSDLSLAQDRIVRKQNSWLRGSLQPQEASREP